MARIFQYHTSISKRDAIGYSMRCLNNYLKDAGISSFLISNDGSQGASSGETHALSAIRDIKFDSDDLLILHHSFLNAELSQILDLPVRKILVYHNITPSSFFIDADMPDLANMVDAGREQLNTIRDAIELSVSDSDYNSQELSRYGYKNRITIPVFYDDEFFSSLALDWPLYLEIKEKSKVNIVFVGRMVPNKRVDKVIEAVERYSTLFSRDISLHVVGKIWNEDYVSNLLSRAAKLGILSSIRMHVDVDQLTLKTLIAAADAMVCLSEHEGFMVPIAEAFSVGCPVIAHRITAVGETMGAAGVGINEGDPALVAGLIELLRRDAGYRRAVIQGQFARSTYFRRELTWQRWKNLLKSELGIPFEGVKNANCL